MGFGDDLEALQEQQDHLEIALQHTQEQLQMMTQENTQLKFELRKESELEQEPLREKVCHRSCSISKCFIHKLF